MSEKASSIFTFIFGDDTRKKLLVEKNLQSYLIKSVLLLTVISAFLIEAAHWIFFWIFRKKAEEMGFSSNHMFFQFIDEQHQVMLGVSLGLTVLLLVVGGLFILNVSNRIAGPIYRLREHLKALETNRNVGSLKFRDKDFFQDIPELVNKLK